MLFIRVPAMIVYNTTLKIDNSIQDGWMQWMKAEHIPETMACGLFTHYKFFRLLDQDESDGVTYILQYFCTNYDDYTTYRNEYHRALQQKAFAKWGSRFIAFHTVMEDVQ